MQVFSDHSNLELPELTDNIYPMIATEHLGLAAGTFFLVGIAAAAYSSADSSLTGLTTSFCLDTLNFDLNEVDHVRKRQFIHLGFTGIIFVLIMIFNEVNNESVLYYFIRTSGFIYGPLLSLFLFGIYSKRRINDSFVPAICILSPLLCVIIDLNSEDWFGGYKFGYDILLVNSLITLIALFFVSSGKPSPS